MPQTPSISHPLRITSPFYLALLLLVLSLLVFYISGWAFYILFREAREYELTKRLETIALALKPTIRANASFALRALQSGNLPVSDEEWIQWFESLQRIYGDRYQSLETDLRNLQENLGLKEVVLISPEKRVIIAVPKPFAPGSKAPLLSADQVAWDSAMAGKAEDIPFYEYEGIPYSRVYAPVWLHEEEEGEPAAILRIEAGLGSFRDIYHLRNQALILGAIVTALMATVAFLLYRLIRRFAQMEQRVAHQDRLEAMGLLVAGVAHEIRNPLGIIRALTEALRGDYKKPQPQHEILTDILGEVDRLNRLVNQYLSFARPEFSDAGENASVREVAESVAKLVTKSDSVHPDRIQLGFSDDIGRARISPTAFRQVILNLLLNALEASPPEAPIHLHGETRRGGSQVSIRITDQGSGIPERELRRVFEPFYSTKTTGSGLGLSISRRLIEEAGGTISIQSKPGEGTTVEVVIPTAK